MAESDIKPINSLYFVHINQRSRERTLNCDVKSSQHMPNYAIIIEDLSRRNQTYNILSYSTLLYAVNNQLPCAFINESNSSLLKHLKPLVFDNAYVTRTKNTSECVSHAIYCKFPFQCILSHPEDPLLILIQVYYNLVLNIFKNALPGNPKQIHSVLNQDSTESKLQITRPDCYKYAECYGMTLNSNYYSAVIRTALREMRSKNSKISSQSLFRKYMMNQSCDELVIMCNVLGNCTVMEFNELYQETERGIKYIKERIKPFYGMDQIKKSLMPAKPYRYCDIEICRNIYIYSDSMGLFHFYPTNQRLRPFFNRYHEIFNSLFFTLFKHLMTIDESELCLNTYCLEITFGKRKINVTLTDEEEKRDAGYPNTLNPIVFIQTKKEMLKSLDAGMFYCSSKESAALSKENTTEINSNNKVNLTGPDPQRTVQVASSTVMFVVFMVWFSIISAIGIGLSLLDNASHQDLKSK